MEFLNRFCSQPSYLIAATEETAYGEIPPSLNKLFTPASEGPCTVLNPIGLGKTQ